VSALTDAMNSSPFSNGTEGHAWTNVWCRYCARDHAQHSPDGIGGCPIVLESMVHTERHPAEAWVPEPDDGEFHLPSRMICMAFAPCGPCGGDPGAEDRAGRVAEVAAYWRGREKHP